HEREAGDATLRIENRTSEFHSIGFSGGTKRVEQQAPAHWVFLQPRIERRLTFGGDPNESNRLPGEFGNQLVPARDQRLVRRYRKEPNYGNAVEEVPWVVTRQDSRPDEAGCLIASLYRRRSLSEDGCNGDCQ